MSLARDFGDAATSLPLTGWLGIWGAILSTILGAATIWEKLWKDRTRLVTTFSFTGQRGVDDKITIVNLSGIPVQVSHWSLAWKPNLFRWRTSTINVTPDEDITPFTIPARDNYILNFPDDYKFDWSYRSALHRQLYLTLHIFGRRPKVLRVGAGQ